jgi:hypothetical protein
VGLLMLFFGGVARDILAATVLVRRRQNAQANEIMRRWKHRYKLPFANWYLKRKAGRPVGFIETKRNAVIINGARGLVNSETFEHLVGALLNKRSKFKLKTPNPFKKGSRHWGKVTIIS